MTKTFEVRRSLNVDKAVTTDPSRLAIVLRNVLHNVLHIARTYVSDGGVIAISSAILDGVVEISVTNSGSQVPAHEAARVFDRCWCGNKSRSQTGSRFGLGLAIVNLATQAIGETVKATCEQGGDLSIVICLPIQGRHHGPVHWRGNPPDHGE